MSLTVAIQMDSMERINIEADSTFALALEAQARGHRLYHYFARDLTLADGALTAIVDLARMDVVLMRQDPPFDMAYITATHMLEHIHPGQDAGGQRSGRGAQRAGKDCW
jgi:glutathione synthase